MITYRFLTDFPTARLHSAFLAAFADYQVNMQMSLADFEYRILRDGLNRSLSAGAFHNDELVGFYLNGAGEWQGITTVYDAGTGVLPQYRAQGIATGMFDFMRRQLNDLGYAQYLLEVLTTNDAAVALYRKLGFKDTRRLAVFRTNERITNSKPAVMQIREPSNLDWKLYQTFWNGYPSWQNSIHAVQRVIDTTMLLEAHVDGRCVGYGAVSKTTGNLFQLAVDQRYRRRGVGSQLLASLQGGVSTDDPLKVNNVDESLVEATGFYKAKGFRLALQQYEMTFTLHPSL